MDVPVLLWDLIIRFIEGAKWSKCKSYSITLGLNESEIKEICMLMYHLTTKWEDEDNYMRISMFERIRILDGNTIVVTFTDDFMKAILK